MIISRFHEGCCPKMSQAYLWRISFKNPDHFKTFPMTINFPVQNINNTSNYKTVETADHFRWRLNRSFSTQSAELLSHVFPVAIKAHKTGDECRVLRKCRRSVRTNCAIETHVLHLIITFQSWPTWTITWPLQPPPRDLGVWKKVLNFEWEGYAFEAFSRNL